MVLSYLSLRIIGVELIATPLFVINDGVVQLKRGTGLGISAITMSVLSHRNMILRTICAQTCSNQELNWLSKR